MTTKAVTASKTKRSIANPSFSMHSQEKEPLQTIKNIPLSMNDVITVILAGGEGKRLRPLTLTRCKPSIPFGGNFCLVDIPISHSISAGSNKTFVISQYLASPLHHHIFQTYKQQGSVEILTAEQRHDKKNWYQGTADAVRQNLDYLLETPVEYFLILSGDQLYNLDFHRLLETAKQTDADLVMGAIPVTSSSASRLGILKINKNSHIVDFFEKPQEKALLQSLKTPQSILNTLGVATEDEKFFLGSMGIYLFKRKALLELLKSDDRDDFGKHLIPTQINKGKTVAYLHDGYWEDIGTIESFYNANIALTESDPHFDLYDPVNPIYRHHHKLPPSKIVNTQLSQAIVCEGSIIEAAEISHSIIGPGTRIHAGTIIIDSYLMGNETSTSSPQIGRDCIIKKAIIDRNVQIGDNVHLTNKKGIREHTNEYLHVQEGIIIVPRGTQIPNGYKF